MLAHVGAGPGSAAGSEAFLVFTNNDDYEDMGWSVLVVDPPRRCRAWRWSRAAPRGDTSKRGAMQAGTDGRSLILSALDGGARDRSAEEFGAFFAAGSRLVAQLGR